MRAIQDAQSSFAKRERDLKRSNSSKLLPETEEQVRLEEQRCGHVVGASAGASSCCLSLGSSSLPTHLRCNTGPAPLLVQRRLRQQLEADRRERALRGPVTEGSMAQALPGSGARVATAKDAGINTGGCDC